MYSATIRTESSSLLENVVEETHLERQPHSLPKRQTLWHKIGLSLGLIGGLIGYSQKVDAECPLGDPVTTSSPTSPTWVKAVANPNTPLYGVFTGADGDVGMTTLFFSTQNGYAPVFNISDRLHPVFLYAINTNIPGITGVAITPARIAVCQGTGITEGPKDGTTWTSGNTIYTGVTGITSNLTDVDMFLLNGVPTFGVTTTGNGIGIVAASGAYTAIGGLGTSNNWQGLDILNFIQGSYCSMLLEYSSSTNRFTNFNGIAIFGTNKPITFPYSSNIKGQAYFGNSTTGGIAEVDSNNIINIYTPMQFHQYIQSILDMSQCPTPYPVVINHAQRAWL